MRAEMNVFFTLLVMSLTFTGLSVSRQRESWVTGALWPSTHRGALLHAGAIS